VDTLVPWLLFTCIIVGLLALDLGVFHRHAHAVSVREAAIWSAVWIALALAFNAGVFVFAGPESGVEFLTGYVIEKSLSVDNIFIFVLIFGYFAVPSQYQHRVLFWGVLGAIVMRGALIAVGASLLESFHWIIYLFGAIVIVSGLRMLTQGDQEPHPDRNHVVRLVRKFFPVTSEYHGQSLLVRQGATLVLTPLAIVLVVVETTDLIFAVDSIPAIFAVTDDAFIVFTSNVFAILGLRSLYFLLAGMVQKFVYLKPALAAVLLWVGAKMLLTDVYKVPTLVSLGVIVALLAIGAIASVAAVQRRSGAGEPPLESEESYNEATP
jgi:tellurite resistance protein TerC